MNINRLTLLNFRSWEDKSLTFGSQVNIIFGKNGRGKTNLLEGIFVLTGINSWRTSRKQEMVRWNTPLATLRGEIEARGREFSIDMTIPFSGQSNILVNHVKMETKSRLSDYFRCILFSPEDLYLVKGPPAQRRELLDTALCQLRPRYAALLEQYGKLLQNKNRLLKTEENRNIALTSLPEYNARMAIIGAALLRYRAIFIQLLDAECRNIHRMISGGREELSLSYKTVSTVTDPTAPENVIAQQLALRLEQLYDAEERAGCCLSGIHRDDIDVYINDRPARVYASQGQTRSAALALKFGERELFFRDNGEYPVLLLDDVLSELDGERRHFICAHTLGGQSIITGCEYPQEFSSSNVIGI